MTSLLVVVMGVSGCGKSTVGKRFSETMSWPFVEADDFHSSQSVAKMKAAVPLTDADRLPWIDRIAAHVNDLEDEGVILACSALTTAVQMRLQEKVTGRQIKWVLLETDEKTIRQRMINRDHFMPDKLLKSQIEALVPPKDAMRFDASLPLTNLIDEFLLVLSLWMAPGN